MNVGKLYLEDGTSYPLQLGYNLIGRFSEICKNNIGVHTDDVYFGRRHFVIEVNPNDSGNYDYILSDFQSKNGTAVLFQAYNLKKELNETSRIYLKNGDTIIAGKTKLRLETAN